MTAQDITWLMANAGPILIGGLVLFVIIVVAFMAVVLWGLMS